jgi:23S rRNA (cytidine1920-2'-O)/16S rRNA (cytidine1409-2'-O)-methyltransferase
MVAEKPARWVDPEDSIALRDPSAQDLEYVSRGGLKLAGALDALGERAPVIDGSTCLDAGASTGGFTDVLLRRGAHKVYAVDVGYGQLAWSLRTDPRVVVRERTNVRYLTREDLDSPVDLVVADLSFISLTKVLGAFANVLEGRGRALVMVKPQFEVGKGKLGAGGVVRDPQARAGAVAAVAQCAQEVGFAVLNVVRSPLPGPKGNVEFFLDLAASADEAVGNGLTGPGLDEAIERETGRDVL